MRFVANNVSGAVIAKAGHWLMEEQTAATVALIRAFLAKPA
jgi:pimeloyl-ACP methyl ester carboxylesterase